MRSYHHMESILNYIDYDEQRIVISCLNHYAVKDGEYPVANMKNLKWFTTDFVVELLEEGIKDGIFKEHEKVVALRKYILLIIRGNRDENKS